MNQFRKKINDYAPQLTHTHIKTHRPGCKHKHFSERKKKVTLINVIAHRLYHDRFAILVLVQFIHLLKHFIFGSCLLNRKTQFAKLK